jgi:hypothetical protein
MKHILVAIAILLPAANALAADGFDIVSLGALRERW